MNESLFWWYIEKRKRKRIKTKDLCQMKNIFEEKILALAGATKMYFEKDPPEHNKFYDRPGDCYDGISRGSEELYNFFESVIMSGKKEYTEFYNNPFKGDVMLFLKRRVSCGNSSCLYFDATLFENLRLTTWQQLTDEYYPSVELLNKIFDIIHD